MIKNLFISIICLGSVNAFEIEKIMGVTIDGNGITYQVETHGCTHKNDFQIEKTPSNINDRPSFSLTLKRVISDRCRMYVPYGTFIFYSWDDLNIEPRTYVKIANPQSILYHD